MGAMEDMIEYVVLSPKLKFLRNEVLVPAGMFVILFLGWWLIG